MQQPTPLLCLTNNLYAKAEYENPTGSVKDRAARFILEAARLHPGSTVIEPTSGNMGIALAALCKENGYDCLIVMPDTMSRERQEMIKAFGGKVVLTPGAEGMAGAVETARVLAKEIPDSFLPGQFQNPAGALAHYRTTGPEIWEQTGGNVAFFVAGVGTGGTISGTARFLKEKNPHIRIVAVEPAGSPLLSRGWAGSHGIQGIGANFVPQILDRTLIDRIVTVSDEAALAATRALHQVGIPAGISSGANMAAAKIFAEQGLCTVTLLPDHKNRYASLGL